MFKSICESYEYMFYRMYRWNYKTWGSSNLSEYKVAGLMVIWSLINVLNVDTLIQILFSFKPLDYFFGVTKLVPLSIMAVSMVIHYLWFIRNSRYLLLARKFQNSERYDDSRRCYLCYIYNAGSLLLLIGLVFVRDEFAH